MKILPIILLLAAIASAQSLPDAPSATRTADKTFWSFTAIHTAAIAADATTTAVYVGHTLPCRYEVGTPWLYGQQAHDGRVIAVMSAEAVVIPLASYLLKKHAVHIGRLQLWRIPLLWSTSTHSYGAIHNLTHC